MMILVVDVIKGMQTQTAECLIIGEITCNHMIVVLNKCDMLPQDKRESMIAKVNILALKTYFGIYIVYKNHEWFSDDKKNVEDSGKDQVCRLSNCSRVSQPWKLWRMILLTPLSLSKIPFLQAQQCLEFFKISGHVCSWFAALLGIFYRC